MRILCKTIDRARAVAGELARQMQKHPEGIVVEIKPYTRPKTRSQVAKIHAMIGDMADQLGYERTDMKEILKREYWPTKIVQLRTKDVCIPKSTAELSREEASMVIERMNHVAAECHIVLKEGHT